MGYFYENDIYIYRTVVDDVSQLVDGVRVIERIITWIYIWVVISTRDVVTSKCQRSGDKSGCIIIYKRATAAAVTTGNQCKATFDMTNNGRFSVT